MQQGHFSADVAYFYGEEGPLTAVFGWKAMTNAPEGYAFDFVNSDVVLHELSFKDGRLVTPGGTSYRILYLGGRSQRMTLPVLRQLERSGRSRARCVVGNRPIDSPSLADDETELQRIADELWGNRAESTHHGHHCTRSGKGQVYICGHDRRMRRWPRSAFRAILSTRNPSLTRMLMFVHRKLADGDVYFVDNRIGSRGRSWTRHSASMEKRRSCGMRRRAKRSQLRIPLPMAAPRFRCISNLGEPRSSSFASRPKRLLALLPEPKETIVAEVDDALNHDWTSTSNPTAALREDGTFDRLISWSDSSDHGIKYFSGTASYSKTIEIPASAFAPGAHLWLDLGDVENIAEVTVNGKYLGHRVEDALPDRRHAGARCRAATRSRSK